MERLGNKRNVTSLERTIADATVKIATMVTIHVDFDKTFIHDLFKSTEFILETKELSKAALSPDAPCLPGGATLYRVLCRIICELSQLCRRAPPGPEDQVLLGAVVADLHSANEAIEQVIQDNPDYGEKILPPKLYAVATGIMLYKLLHPEVEASEPWVQIKVKQALDIIQKLPPPYRSSPYLSWPIYIVGCAVTQDSDKVILRRAIDSLWDVSSYGGLRRASRTLEANWMTKNKDHSGLNMLLYGRSSIYQQ